MALTPPTLVCPTAVGRIFELSHFVLNAQNVEAQNPDSTAVITNLNYDADTNTGAFQVNFAYTTTTDAVTGDPVMTITDPFIDPI